MISSFPEGDKIWYGLSLKIVDETVSSGPFCPLALKLRSIGSCLFQYKLSHFSPTQLFMALKWQGKGNVKHVYYGLQNCITSIGIAREWEKQDIF